MIKTRSGRRGALLGFTVMAVVLGLASTAWACTVFKGQMKVRGDWPGHESHTVTAVGNNSGMGWCSLTGHANADGVYDSSNDIYVEVSQAPSSCGGHKLPASGTDLGSAGLLKYAVTYVDYGFKSRSLYRNCMAVGGHSNTVKVGDIKVDSSGFGSGYYNIPGGPVQDGSPWEAGVCVSDTNYNPSLYGNQAPVIIY